MGLKVVISSELLEMRMIGDLIGYAYELVRGEYPGNYLFEESSEFAQCLSMYVGDLTIYMEDGNTIMLHDAAIR